MEQWTNKDEDKLQKWMKKKDIRLYYHNSSDTWGSAKGDNNPLYWFSSIYELKLFLIKKMTENKSDIIQLLN